MNPAISPLLCIRGAELSRSRLRSAFDEFVRQYMRSSAAKATRAITPPTTMPAIAPGERLEEEDDAAGVAETIGVGVTVEDVVGVAVAADPVTLTVTVAVVAVAAKEDIDCKASCGTA